MGKDDITHTHEDLVPSPLGLLLVRLNSLVSRGKIQKFKKRKERKKKRNLHQRRVIMTSSWRRQQKRRRRRLRRWKSSMWKKRKLLPPPLQNLRLHPNPVGCLHPRPTGIHLHLRKEENERRNGSRYQFSVRGRHLFIFSSPRIGNNQHNGHTSESRWPEVENGYYGHLSISIKPKIR